MTTKLSINVNAIAYLRNRRGLPWPDVAALGAIALDAGAYGLTVHPRPDERHIRRTDVFTLIEMIRGRYPGREFNIEGYPDEGFLAMCEAAKPDQVTLVPDQPGQSTSDHGFDVIARRDELAAIVARLHRGGMRTSIFVDADPQMGAAAKATGTDRIEIYTGPYGHTFDPALKAVERAKVVACAQAAHAAGLKVNAGHDLTVDNLPPLLVEAPMIAEVSIGHAVTADALAFGMAETVRRFLKACGA